MRLETASLLADTLQSLFSFILYIYSYIIYIYIHFMSMFFHFQDRILQRRGALSLLHRRLLQNGAQPTPAPWLHLVASLH